MFILYQILEAVRDTHDRGLHLGDITLNHLFVDNALYLSLLPNIQDNLLYPDSLHILDKYSNNDVMQKLEAAKINFQKKNAASNLSQSLDASKGVADWDSEHSDSCDHSLDKNCSTLNQRSSICSEHVMNVGKKSEMLNNVNGNEDNDQLNGESVSLEDRLCGYQRLMSSGDAFEILKQVRHNDAVKYFQS